MFEKKSYKDRKVFLPFTSSLHTWPSTCGWASPKPGASLWGSEHLDLFPLFSQCINTGLEENGNQNPHGIVILCVALYPIAAQCRFTKQFFNQIPLEAFLTSWLVDTLDCFPPHSIN